ncbi:methyltransferase domain-containing protein [Nocardioides anomalus]|uniref:Methyltransferase domain-containing protein n=1 Tax=Nocardioides anomalus TaxID=2712223 RepID=A0A6G6W9D8_9ACTN|nr:methyltransferase domain-containing protein [Nocardioides anomalus]QIG41819.1 methyltransferase domain-containing protein [Nocardioides anomalus]
MDVASVAWLQAPEGQSVLARASALDLTDPLAARAALSRAVPDVPPEHLAAALTQASLRAAAVPKFGALAASMYFTPDGLEQATRLAVATHRAARLVAFGAATVVDLGCGIGGDLVAFARAGLTAAGVDLDPVRVAVASANLEALGLAGAVQVADAAAVDTTPFDVAFVDPARRTGRGRTFSPDAWAPSWAFASSLLTRDACVKTAPGIPHDLVPAGVEAEWVSDHGEVKEAALWGGRLATCARRATVIGDGGLATLTEEDDPGADVVPLGRYLYEPDGAVIRAGLVTAVAAGVGGGLLDPHIAYVTSDAAYRTPYGRSYEVLETLPHREKQLRAALHERGIGRLTIKKRGVDVVPDQLRKRLALTGDAEATIVLTRVGGHGTCLLVRPF